MAEVSFILLKISSLHLNTMVPSTLQNQNPFHQVSCERFSMSCCWQIGTFGGSPSLAMHWCIKLKNFFRYCVLQWR